MGKIDQNLNWKGPLDGIMYYMEDGKQMFRSPRNAQNSEDLQISDYIGMPRRCVEPHVLASSMAEALTDEIKDLETADLLGRLSDLFEKIRRRYGGSEKCLSKGLISQRGADLFQDFEYHDPLEDTPLLYAATIRRSEITFFPLPPVRDGHRLILLQIDLTTGEYHKYTRTLPAPEAAHPFIMKKRLLRDGFYFPFAFIAGPGFINGVMLRTP